MKNLVMKNLVLLIFALLLVLGLAGAQDEGPLSSLHFVVIRDSDGKPVRNAEVVLHPVNRKGKQTHGEMELKTDAEGKTSVDAIPYGPLSVEVMAPHFQTFGEDYEVNKPVMEVSVKLKRPGEQYSIYDNHDDKKPQ